jgi:hypothetical protein
MLDGRPIQIMRQQEHLYPQLEIDHRQLIYNRDPRFILQRYRAYIRPIDVLARMHNY